MGFRFRRDLIVRPYRYFKIFCFSLGFLMILSFVGVTAYSIHAYRSLPNMDRMTFVQLQAQARRMTERKIDKKKKLHPWVDLNDVSRDYLYAIVMSEDSTFFEHEGVNFDAMIEAALRDLKKKKLESGASTITQQVVKNIFLSDEKSFVRKLKEVLIARRLEHHFSKNQILELYFNLAEFGPDIFGVAHAANHYFKKKPSQINAAEGAFIALMLPSPRKFHYAVFENQNVARTKRKKLKRILGDMLANELISPKQYHRYLKYRYFGEAARNLARD